MYELLYWEITHQQIFNSFYVLGCALGNDSIKKGKKDKYPALWRLTLHGIS